MRTDAANNRIHLSIRVHACHTETSHHRTFALLWCLHGCNRGVSQPFSHPHSYRADPPAEADAQDVLSKRFLRNIHKVKNLQAKVTHFVEL